MDYLDLNQAASQYQIDYGVPRIFHIRSSDFQHVTSFDRVDTPGKFVFGELDLREKSCTPYSSDAIRDAMEQERNRHELALRSFNALSNGASSCQQHINPDQAHEGTSYVGNLPPHMKILVESIVQSHKDEFAREVQILVERRFTLMSDAIFSALSHQLQPSQANTLTRSTSLEKSTSAQECSHHRNGSDGVAHPGTIDREATHGGSSSHGPSADVAALDSADANVVDPTTMNSHEHQGQFRTSECGSSFRHGESVAEVLIDATHSASCINQPGFRRC